jgi:hypothetical protein
MTSEKRGRRPVMILHAGPPKTGTSALQSTFAKNVASLLEHNICYPDDASLSRARSNQVTSGNGVALAILLGAKLGDHIATDHVWPEIRAALERGNDLLYSSEAISAFDPDDFRMFRQTAEELGYHIKVVIYIRAIADHALSCYHQYIKEGLTRFDFNDFLRNEYGRPQTNIIQNLLKVFDATDIQVRNYDRMPSGIARDFFEHVLGLADLSGFEMEEPRVNRSLTPTEAALMRVMAPMFATRLQARVASDSIIYGLPRIERRPLISPAAMKLVEELHGADLELINSHLPAEPIALKSDDLIVADEPEPPISEGERVLAAMIAGLIRTAKLDTFL